MSDELVVTTILSLLAGVWAIFLIPALGLWALQIVANWKLYEKANENGWAAVIPFYTDYTMYKICWGNGWFFLLTFVPIANIVIHIITMIKLSNAFGKDGGWACGLIFLNLIFLCIMAFSSEYQYVGVPGEGNSAAGTDSSGDYQNPYSQTGYQQSSQGSQYYYQQPSASRSAKYCPYCGVALEGTPKFCHKCGKPL